jgi:SAM-dependent methyltransferase
VSVDENNIQTAFMERMVVTYSKVHNQRYWNEIEPYIKDLASGVCLDIGCGPGLLLQDLYLKFNSTKLIGIDLSSVMLEKAGESLTHPRKEGKVKLIQQHMQENHSLPMGIDLVFSSRVLRSFDDQISIMQSIHKALNKDGKLILLDWDQNSIKTYYDYFRSSEEFQNISIEDIIRLHRNFSRYSIQDWRFILENCGFKVDYTFQLNPVHIVVIASKSNLNLI